MPPPTCERIYFLLECTDGYVLTALDLIEGHVGQGGIAIGVKRPGAESTVKILDREYSFVDCSAVGGDATSGADILDRLEGYVHGLIAVHSVGLSQFAVLGFVVLDEL
jgi:hypothetical protein